MATGGGLLSPMVSFPFFGFLGDADHEEDEFTREVIGGDRRRSGGHDTRLTENVAVRDVEGPLQVGTRREV